MQALRAEYFSQQFGCTVGDQMLFGVITGGVHQAHDFDNAFDAIQIATCLLYTSDAADE